MWGSCCRLLEGLTGAPSQKYTWRVAALQGSAFSVAEPFAKLRAFLHNIRILPNSLIGNQKRRTYCGIFWTNSNLPSRQQTEHLFPTSPVTYHSHRPPQPPPQPPPRHHTFSTPWQTNFVPSNNLSPCKPNTWALVTPTQHAMNGQVTSSVTLTPATSATHLYLLIWPLAWEKVRRLSEHK
jgi:hypothetical protein